jgi:hypothetical protein
MGGSVAEKEQETGNWQPATGNGRFRDGAARIDGRCNSGDTGPVRDGRDTAARFVLFGALGLVVLVAIVVVWVWARRDRVRAARWVEAARRLGLVLLDFEMRRRRSFREIRPLLAAARPAAAPRYHNPMVGARQGVTVLGFILQSGQG